MFNCTQITSIAQKAWLTTCYGVFVQIANDHFQWNHEGDSGRADKKKGKKKLT